MLVFEERGKPEYPEKNLSEQRREPTPNSTHIRRHRRELNPDHVGERRALSPLRHPLLPNSPLLQFDKTPTQCEVKERRLLDACYEKVVHCFLDVWYNLSR